MCVCVYNVMFLHYGVWQFQFFFNLLYVLWGTEDIELRNSLHQKFVDRVKITLRFCAWSVLSLVAFVSWIFKEMILSASGEVKKYCSRNACNLNLLSKQNLGVCQVISLIYLLSCDHICIRCYPVVAFSFFFTNEKKFLTNFPFFWSCLMTWYFAFIQFL